MDLDEFLPKKSGDPLGELVRQDLDPLSVKELEERIVVLECEIDDMNPQLFGPLMDRLYEGGALDVFYAPVQMKKNRPGTLVTVIATPAQREALARFRDRSLQFILKLSTVPAKHHRRPNSSWKRRATNR